MLKTYIKYTKRNFRTLPISNNLLNKITKINVYKYYNTYYLKTDINNIFIVMSTSYTCWFYCIDAIYWPFVLFYNNTIASFN